jgi:hypothetical protein
VAREASAAPSLWLSGDPDGVVYRLVAMLVRPVGGDQGGNTARAAAARFESGRGMNAIGRPKAL